MPTLTFVATANAVVYTGAEPVFVDCEPATGNVDVGLLAELLDRLRRRGRAGRRGDAGRHVRRLRRLRRLLPRARRPDVPLVEDAAEALGATAPGRPAGSFGRAAALSFNGNKIITTSGGGMLLSDDAGPARPLPLPRHPGPPAGAALRARRVRLQLPAQQPRSPRARPGPAVPARRRCSPAAGSCASGTPSCSPPSPGVRLLGEDDHGIELLAHRHRRRPGRAGWRAADLARPPRRAATSRPARSGSRCTCSRSSPRPGRP